MYGVISSALENQALHCLQCSYDAYDDEHRQRAKLNSCGGPVSGKWLNVFPSKWWPRMTDDIFVLAVKFRCGIPVCREGDLFFMFLAKLMRMGRRRSRVVKH